MCLTGLMLRIAKARFYSGNIKKTEPWIELFSFVFECLVNQSPYFQTFGKSLIMSKSGSSIFTHILSYGCPDKHQMKMLRDIFRQFRYHSSLVLHELRVEALDVVISLLNTLSIESDKFMYQNLVLLLANTLPLVALQNEVSTIRLLDQIRLKIDSKVIHFEGMLDSVVEIMQYPTIPRETKKSAIKLALELVYGRLNYQKKVTEAVLELVSLEDVLTDESIWLRNTTNNKAEDPRESMTRFGKQMMDKLVLRGMGDDLFDALSSTLESYVSNDREFGRRRAVMFFVPYLQKLSQDNFGSVMNMVEFSLTDQHPRVRWEAANAVLRLSERLIRDPLMKERRDNLLVTLHEIAMQSTGRLQHRLLFAAEKLSK